MEVAPGARLRVPVGPEPHPHLAAFACGQGFAGPGDEDALGGVDEVGAAGSVPVADLDLVGVLVPVRPGGGPGQARFGFPDAEGVTVTVVLEADAGDLHGCGSLVLGGAQAP